MNFYMILVPLFSIIKRSIYDDLPNKPPLHGVTQCDIGIE